MAIVYPNYPRGLSDKKLIEAIDEYANEINASRVNINTVLQLSPYISLGLNELQSRQSKRVTRISLGISVLSLFIAALALYVSLESGRSIDVSSARQTAILEELSKNILENQKTITQTIKAQKDTSAKQIANPAIQRTRP
jgi:uncharacterized coiled-coil protein SlyX